MVRTWEERLGKLGLSILEKRTQRGNLMATCNYPRRKRREDGDTPWMCTEKGQEAMNTNRKFHLDVTKLFFIMREVKYLNGLPREVLSEGT